MRRALGRRKITTGTEPLIDLDLSSPVAYAAALLVPLVDGFFPLVPAESLVIALGVLAGSGDARAYPLALLAAFGAFLGDSVSYRLGARFGTRAADRLLRGARGRRTRDWAERTLKQHGERLILMARIVPGGPTPVTLVAGVAAFPSARFHGAAAGGALLWAGYAFSIGFLGGHTFSDRPLAGLLLALGMAAAVTLAIEAGRRVAGRRRARVHL